MTVQEALRQGARLLSAEGGSDEANLEAELLLGHALGLDRAHLYQHLREPLTPEQQSAYDGLLERRRRHEPAAYITGRREFYGLDLEVTPAAMIPRPETELLVELALDFAGSRVRGQGSGVSGSEFRVVDVGVGCGAIALALAANLPPEVRVVGIDVSAEALALARRNAERLGLGGRLLLVEGDLLGPLASPVAVIVGNLPYVRTADWEAAPPEIRCFEPRRALDGGPDGLRLIERLLRQAPAYLKPAGALVLEIGDKQGTAASALAGQAFPRAQVRAERDLSGLDRVLVVGT
ncbi:MAG: peptide chain release factor N(5)-glutamine methyltransferase [Chloroflexi bacterium]|nr:peptide chain release factor N(5)-glutamine methyltransferase [Chloroflexota bacterium]